MNSYKALSFFRYGNAQSDENRKTNWLKLLGKFLLLVSVGLTACTDPVDVDLGESIPQLTVDAWITDEVKPDTIKLTTTQQYFATSFNPGVTGATVSVTDLNTNEVFTYTDAGSGNYVYNPTQPISKLGHSYRLDITSAGESYEAFTTVNRTVPIDSVTFTFEEEELGQNEGYYAEFYAQDSSGVDPDFYWIRAYKWDESEQRGFWLNKPGELTVSADGTFSPNARQDNLDLFQFIFPLRRAINPLPDEDDDSSPYDDGDSVYVELHSTDEASYYFFVELSEQINNGGLFATPLANVPTNLVNKDANSTEKAVGWFGMSLVSTKGKKLEI